MDKKEIQNIISKQRSYFNSHETKSLLFRKKQLYKLERALSKYENEIIEALQKDLNRPEIEAYAADIHSIKKEAQNALIKACYWSLPKGVASPLLFTPALAYVKPEPYGCTLIIGPWNYPFDLTLSPLVGAIAAGNTAIIKPSEQAPNCSAVIAKLIKETFNEEYIAVVEGAVEEATVLLNEKFDYIFFTGGEEVGKIVAKSAANHLTPVTLELGGKSPCIVDKYANIKVAAKRIAWGNAFNAGQTCISPDYLFVHSDIKEEFIEEVKKAYEQFYQSDVSQSRNYGRIINKKHFDRITGLMEKGDVLVGGKTDTENLFIEPTVIGNVSAEDPIMQEEIFGPVMPLLEYTDFDEVIDFINDRPKPLALYLFSHSLLRQRKIIAKTSSGGVSINDVMAHYRNKNLPFGGVGTSGMGAYHFKGSFDTFSHFKSIQKRSNLDLGLEFPPYNMSLRTVKVLLKMFS